MKLATSAVSELPVSVQRAVGNEDDSDCRNPSDAGFGEFVLKRRESPEDRANVQVLRCTCGNVLDRLVVRERLIVVDHDVVRVTPLPESKSDLPWIGREDGHVPIGDGEFEFPKFGAGDIDTVVGTELDQ